MSKVLYLMRHGKAEHTPGMDDFDRGLIDRGMKDVKRQAVRLFKEDIPDYFVASSSIRTTQTVLHLQNELGFNKDRIEYDESLYLCSIKDLLRCINELDDRWRNVCIVGHNPSINYLAEYLTNEDIGHVATSGVVKMTLEGRWSEISQGTCHLEYYQSPK